MSSITKYEHDQELKEAQERIAKAQKESALKNRNKMKAYGEIRRAALFKKKEKKDAPVKNVQCEYEAPSFK